MTAKQLNKVKHLAAYAKKARTRKKNEKRLSQYYRCVIQVGIDWGRVASSLSQAITQLAKAAGLAVQGAGEALIAWGRNLQQDTVPEQGVTKNEDNEPVLRLPGP